MKNETNNISEEKVYRNIIVKHCLSKYDIERYSLLAKKTYMETLRGVLETKGTDGLLHLWEDEELTKKEEQKLFKKWGKFD